MDLRKFYFILTIFSAIVLFVFGSGILVYINANIDIISSEVYASGDQDSHFANIINPLVQKRDPFNILLLGGDKVNNLTDTMMLANFDPETGKINIMSIPRDTRVFIKNKERKINYAFPSGGVELAVKTLSELLDVNIKYYAFVDTSAFRKIIDLLDGVDYYIPVDMDYDDPTQNLHIHLKKGQQRLNGEQAEQYVRFRKPNRWNKEIRKYYDGSDLKRNEAQQQFVKELMRQKLTIQYLPKLTSVINTVFDSVKTNLTLNETVRLTSYVTKFNIDNVSFIQMPGTTYDASPYYYICDVAAARKIMAESFKCKDSFVTADEEAKAFYLKSEAKYVPPPKPVASEEQSGDADENSDMSENPSNSESLITGSDQDP
ncbi:MAG TPA: LCP family protein [Clostridiales bacterium]|jgi:LCP family protein required for cell wall assembly|nr:LCP family protein [Clostridiales bacterium]HPZ05564.1 LCP family protein [Clostridiales bacterium]HQD31851.1 LCP family protein [Clostridiales bacterium]